MVATYGLTKTDTLAFPTQLSGGEPRTLRLKLL